MRWLKRAGRQLIPTHEGNTVQARVAVFRRYTHRSGELVRQRTAASTAEAKRIIKWVLKQDREGLSQQGMFYIAQAYKQKSEILLEPLGEACRSQDVSLLPKFKKPLKLLHRALELYTTAAHDEQLMRSDDGHVVTAGIQEMQRRISTVCRLLPFLMYGPVLLHGLSDESLNGLHGTATEFDQSVSRYVVKYTPHGETEENLDGGSLESYFVPLGKRSHEPGEKILDRGVNKEASSSGRAVPAVRDPRL